MAPPDRGEDSARAAGTATDTAADTARAGAAGRDGEGGGVAGRAARGGGGGGAGASGGGGLIWYEGIWLAMIAGAIRSSSFSIRNRFLRRAGWSLMMLGPLGCPALGEPIPAGCLGDGREAGVPP